MKLVVVSAGLSVPSSTRLLGDRLAVAAQGQAPADAPVEVQVVELRELAVAIAHNFTNGFPDRALSAALDAVTEADGLVVVTPVFAASYSGLFKSFFDVIDPEALRGKPVLIAATGGTARHSLVLEHALRPLFAYLKAVIVPTGVYAASEDWGAEGLDGRIERAAGELVRLMEGLSLSRPRPADGASAPAAGAGEGTAAGRAVDTSGSRSEEVSIDPSGRGLVGVSLGGSGRAFEGFEVVPFEEQLAALRPVG
ncbi:FMN reductase [Streptomyces sp. NPDC002309]